MAHASSPAKSLRVLGGLLVILAIIYGALLPRLRSMSEEAERINREVDRQGDRSFASGSSSARTKDVDRLRSIVEANPTDAAARLQLAGSLRDVGRLQEAEEMALEAARLRPKEPGPLLLLADIEHREKHFDVSIATYRQVLREFPDHPEAAASLGWLYISLGWTQEANEVLAKAVNARPSETPLQVALALAQLQLSNLGRAERILLAVRQSHPDQVALWSPLVDVYLKAKRPEDALRVADEALAKSPNDVRLLNGKGQALYDSGDPASALKTFQKVCQLENDNILAHHRSALCYKRLNRPLDAIREMETAYRQSPGFENASQILGQLYLQNGRTEEGRRLLRQWEQGVPAQQRYAKAGYNILHKPKSARAHYEMALSYRELKDQPRMIVELSRAIELDPHVPAAAQLLTEALLQRAAQEKR